MSKQKEFRRTNETLRATIRALCEHIWGGSSRLRDGPHLWTIPVDHERDFDCILSDATSELEDRREAMKTAGHALKKWDY